MKISRKVKTGAGGILKYEKLQKKVVDYLKTCSYNKDDFEILKIRSVENCYDGFIWISYENSNVETYFDLIDFGVIFEGFGMTLYDFQIDGPCSTFF